MYGINDVLNLSVRVCDSSNVFAWRSLFTVFKSRLIGACCWSPGLGQSATGCHISVITGHLSQASEDSSVHRVCFDPKHSKGKSSA